MSARPRISVLRLRQLSTARLYDRLEESRNLDVARLRQEGREASTSVRELPPRPLRFAVPGAPAGGSEVSQPRYELVLAEPGSLVQGPRRLPVLAAEQMALRTPQDALQSSLRRRPFLLDSRVVVHADDRA
jgi:hypothetical protein